MANVRLTHTFRQDVAWGGVVGALFPFVLFWTVMYGMVHVY